MVNKIYNIVRVCPHAKVSDPFFHPPGQGSIFPNGSTHLLVVGHQSQLHVLPKQEASVVNEEHKTSCPIAMLKNVKIIIYLLNNQTKLLFITLLLYYFIYTNNKIKKRVSAKNKLLKRIYSSNNPIIFTTFFMIIQWLKIILDYPVQMVLLSNL